MQSTSFSTRLAFSLLLLLVPVLQARAAAPVETIPADLPALIRAAAANPNQFAVSVAHQVSLQDSGSWSSNGTRDTWNYAARISGAVSMSFHAPRVHLPPGAILTIRSSATTTTYRAADIGARGDFWSRVQPGDTLEFELVVPTTSRTEALLQIVSFQAGYRGLSREVPHHPIYQRVRAMAAGDPDTQCVENYACHVTPGNSPVAQATVALLIGNVSLCTGTLLNNIAQDQTPYVLTARHCQNGAYGGGAPGAASSVTVYWNAITDCGTVLGSVFYAPGRRTQTGATTVFEQQDAWLIQLDAGPVVEDAHFAGFDASGGPFSGGYTIHHALSYTRQITRWAGMPYVNTEYGVLGTSFTSNLLETVNALGTSGPGASGAGLVTDDHRVVGVLALGRTGNSQSGYGSCPLPVPPEPDANTSTTMFISLAAIWDSVADTTSSTGSRTLRSLLDPDNTGAMSVGSMQATRMQFTASTHLARWDDVVTLTWHADNATQCTALGGSNEDGWSGTLPSSGSRTVTQSSTGTFTYRIRCALPGGGSVSSTLVLSWSPPNAQPRFVLPRFSHWTTQPLTLQWESVLGPCSLNGGSVSESNLPASGSVVTTSDTPADFTYVLTCGAPGFTSTTQHTVSFVTPTLDFAVNSTRRRIGEPLHLAWYSLADSCAPTGGGPDDNWARTPFPGGGGIHRINSVQSTGTFTYGLNCMSGPISVTKRITVVVEDAPPRVSLMADPASVTLAYSPADYIRLHYSSNVGPCSWSSSGVAPRPELGPILPPNLSSLSYEEGVRVIPPAEPGVLRVSVTCGRSAELLASASTEVTVLPPPPPTVTISSSATEVALGTPFTISWSSSNTRHCTASGGAPENATLWPGSVGVSGTYEARPLNNVAVDAVYTISCASIDPGQAPATASVTVAIGTPGVSLFSSVNPVNLGGSFSLSWNHANASECRASGGGANGEAWNSAVATSGSAVHTASVLGQHTYALECLINGVWRRGEVVMTVREAPVPPPPPPPPPPAPPPAPPPSGGGGNGGGGNAGGGSSSGGGGGVSGAWEILMLLAMAAFIAAGRERSSARVRGASLFGAR